MSERTVEATAGWVGRDGVMDPRTFNGKLARLRRLFAARGLPTPDERSEERRLLRELSPPTANRPDCKNCGKGLPRYSGRFREYVQLDQQWGSSGDGLFCSGACAQAWGRDLARAIYTEGTHMVVTREAET